MNVLSLFDGMSCGQIALNNLGIKVDKYFASEIDKYAMEIAKKNFPDIIHVGNVEFVTKGMLNNKIDLIIGGSPCQGFSRAGKGLNFEDPRSKLFFEFVRLIKECKPKYFMLENVKMNKESRDIISEYLGVEPIYIDSALLSAQTRKRYYWTNIPNISEPIDKGIILKDIIQTTEELKGSEVDERMVTNKGKAYCLTARYSGATWWNSIERSQRTMIRIEDKVCFPEATKKGYVAAGIGQGIDIQYPNSQTRRGRLLKEKSHCIQAGSVNQGIINEKYNWRKLTPIECERLQTVPDNYTEGVSNSQRYKMLGNGWTVKVIEHVLTNMDV
jgi:DNA (cytosine-5)-methyltransferase 3A|tara:strand:- start:83 stop:1069 length:987 start_codon:yes stop_codon:yes gene_type:complete